MKISDILFEGYPEAEQSFSQEADPATAKQVIAAYRDLVNKNQVQGNERNIDWWRKQGWEKFSQFVNAKAAQPTKTQVKRKMATGKSITLADTPEWLIVIPIDKNASCFHGRDTEWCTAKPNQPNFEKYVLNSKGTLIYCLSKQTGGRWAIHLSDDIARRVQYWDQNDKMLSSRQFQQQTGLNPVDLMNKAATFDVYRAQGQARDEFTKNKQAAVEKLKAMNFSTLTKRDPEIEKSIMASLDSEIAYNYVSAIGDKLGPQDFPEPLTTLTNQPKTIKYIKNPTEAQQLAAVRVEHATNEPSTLSYIKNPSTKVIKAYAQANPNQLKFNSDTQKLISELPNTPPEILKLVQSGIDKDTNLNNASEEEQLATVKNYGDAEKIKFIKNPSQAVQIAAVSADGSAIKYIDDPDEVVQMAAVNNNGSALELIKNPTPRVIDAAIDSYGNNIQYVKNPTEDQQLRAVNNTYYAIDDIANPTEQVQLTALNNSFDKENPRLDGKHILDVFKKIKNPTPKATALAKKLAVAQDAVNKKLNYDSANDNVDEKKQIELIKKDASNISQIENPSEKLQMMAIKADPSSFEYINNPTPAVQKIAVEKDGMNLQYIQDPNEQLQNLALQETPWAIQFVPIEYRTPEMEIDAYDREPDVFEWIKEPSGELIEHAVEDNPYNIKYVEYPTNYILQTAILSDPGVISELNTIDPETQDWIMDNYPENFGDIQNPDEEIIFRALENDGENIQYVQAPTDDMQMTAIQNNPESLLRLSGWKKPEWKESLAAYKKLSQKFKSKVDWQQVIDAVNSGKEDEEVADLIGNTTKATKPLDESIELARIKELLNYR